MATFRSLVDSPKRVHISPSDTWQSPHAAAEVEGGFRIDIDEPTGGPVVVAVSGDLDAVTAPVLTACLDQALHTGHNVVIDLLGVRFLGCAGIEAVHHTAQRRRLTMAASPEVHAMLGRIGIAAAMPCFDTLADAFRAARSRASADASHADPPILGHSQPLNCSFTALSGTVQ
ncbi:STAS domain-containing protein [Rhodococcus opacus]|uniref:STAS domain-containing protein n=1 Tax=Rhodococcus opacus (strain B4) TaxID=632772 RepID=C1B6X8_RHOOB|nr:STAS domain-containing protein [Rhodococcus opacus]BAH51431.1 hypothetical protein ROP_31840 [Rhodococcus opacus B4]